MQSLSDIRTSPVVEAIEEEVRNDDVEGPVGVIREHVVNPEFGDLPAASNLRDATSIIRGDRSIPVTSAPLRAASSAALPGPTPA